MRRALIILVSACFMVLLACGEASPSTSVSPTPTTPAITPTSVVRPVDLELHEAPGYSYNPYTDDQLDPNLPLSDACDQIGGCYPHVDCSNVDWSVLVANGQQDASGRPTQQMDWYTTVGGLPSFESPPGFSDEPAPDIMVFPASGTLAPGQQALVHIAGSYAGGSLFYIGFKSPQSPTVWMHVALKCVS
jgi:hypothetical protein